MLRAILSNHNISLYQLEKISHISHATLNDIYNERSNINNCSVLVMSKIAASLNMDIDSLYKKLAYDDLSLFTYSEDFDLFKSSTLQRLKNEGEETFLRRVVGPDQQNRLSVHLGRRLCHEHGGLVTGPQPGKKGAGNLVVRGSAPCL